MLSEKIAEKLGLLVPTHEASGASFAHTSAEPDAGQPKQENGA